MNPAIPWYKSNMLRGLVTAAVAKLVAYFHLGQYVDSDVAGQVVDGALEVIEWAALAFAARARVQQQVATAITSTQAKADVHNAAPFIFPAEPPSNVK